MKILLIIPAYNEEKNILKTYSDIKNTNKKVDVIIINDGSKDKTEQICIDNHIPYISLIHNLGIGGAVQTGYKYAYENDYDVAVQFDGDGQHDARYINALVEPIISGQADFVIGSRFIGNISKFKSTTTRRVGIKIICFLVKLVTGKTVTDPTSGFRAANKEIVSLFANNYPQFPEPESIVTLIKNKYRILEVPVRMHERKAGISSIRAWKSVYYMTNVGLSVVVNSIKTKGGK
jgi:glycosyltransferase involved in cell wall biosynthesis